MHYFYAFNNEQKGPIDADEFAQLVRQGVITSSTMVWKEGLPNWQPYGDVRGQFPGDGLAPPSSPVNAGREEGMRLAQPVNDPQNDATAVCAVTGVAYPKKEMIHHQGQWVHRSVQDVFFREMAQEAATLADRVPAGFWIRFLAAIMDGILLGITFSILGSLLIPILGEPNPDPEVFTQADMNHLIFNTLIGLTYYTFMHGKFGATLGKMAVGIYIIRPDGSPVSYPRACGRYFAEILSALTFGIGYLMAAFDQEKRALHDFIAGTRVVKRK